MPHRQVVLTIPKRLRRAFQFDRRMLTDLCQAAWLSLRDVMRTRLGTPKGQPGVIIAIQTFGDYLNFHPHLHILITDGAFVGTHTFHALHYTDWQQVAELLRARVIKFFVKKEKLSSQEAQKLRQWHNSGFGIHAGHRIQKDDHDGLENLAQYILRNPFSLEKMTYFPETGEVIYRSKRNHATKRLWETFDGPAFIAAITRHIPVPGQHLVRYYGAYSNRARGERRKQVGNAPPPSAADTPLPNRRSYADFATKREADEHQQRAEAFDQGLTGETHSDANVPSSDGASAADIEIIELPRDAFPRIPRKKWRELIQKVWETDPLICPNCARTMRIVGILEDRDAAASLLHTLGWFAYATESQGARAPPPCADPDAPELPFTTELDGIAYELEPWEQARRDRLQRYAQQRDQVAGIVIYDGEWCEAEAWPPSQHENQAATFPDDIDQRPPPQWDSDTQVTPDAWTETPLGAWAETANQWIDVDDADQRLPVAWEAQQGDQTSDYWNETPLALWAGKTDNWDGIDFIPPEDEPVFYTD